MASENREGGSGAQGGEQEGGTRGLFGASSSDSRGGINGTGELGQSRRDDQLWGGGANTSSLRNFISDNIHSRNHSMASSSHQSLLGDWDGACTCMDGCLYAEVSL